MRKLEVGGGIGKGLTSGLFTSAGEDRFLLKNWPGWITRMNESCSRLRTFQTAAPAAIHLRRAADLPGVEVREVEQWSEQWRCCCVGFEFVSSRSWHGDVIAKGFRGELRPGAVFCCYPGEVYSTPRVYEAGGGSSLTVDAATLFEHLAEFDITPANLTLRRISAPGSKLARSLSGVFESFDASASASERQTSFAEFIAVLAGDLLEKSPASARLAYANRAAESRMQEWLRLPLGDSPGLKAVGSESGLSRFQALRAFKRSYGLPPHAYQLCVRIGLAQRALLAGAAPAAVAAELGFVDQSHFSRHFKRIVGLTPAAYASDRSREGLTVLSA